jgi:nifR3 family TIM-barrel protein
LTNECRSLKWKMETRPHQLKPLRIGAVELGFPAVLASLAGYSDLAHRLVCRSLGAPYAGTEAMLAHMLLGNDKLRRRLVRTDAADHPVAGQLLGSEPEVMARAAAVLDGMGFDVVDLNFACPVKKVLGRGRGGALMRQPGLALDIVREVVRAAPRRPVTVKLRRAFDGGVGGDEAFWKIVRGTFDAGAAAVCVHARTVEQKYRGRADWDFLARVKDAFPDRTVIGSGDVFRAEDVLEMVRRTGVDGASVARGAIGNPWIFGQARALAAGGEARKPGPAEQRALIERHFELTSRLYGPRFAVKKMRRFSIHYAGLHPHPGRARAAYIAVRSLDDWRAALDALYPPAG